MALQTKTPDLTPDEPWFSKEDFLKLVVGGFLLLGRPSWLSAGGKEMLRHRGFPLRTGVFYRVTSSASLPGSSVCSRINGTPPGLRFYGRM